MKKTKILFTHIVLYGIVVFASNWISKYPLKKLLILTQNILGYNTFSLIIASCLQFLIPLGTSWISVYFLFKIQQVSSHYDPDVDKFYWIKSCMKLVIPAEIIRFLISSFDLGIITKAGYFALPATFLFESTYLIWSGRGYAVRQELSYIFSDYVVYNFCYLIYLAIHLFGIFMIYRHFWLVGKNECEDLVVYESKQRFY